MAPAGTPREVIDRVYRDSARILALRGLQGAPRADRHGAGGQQPGRFRRGDPRGVVALGQGDQGPGARAEVAMKIDIGQVEDVARELYIRALKILPPDVKSGFDAARRLGDRRHGPGRARHHDRQHPRRRGDREPALPGHRHPDLQRDHRPRRRGRRRASSSAPSAAAASARRASTRCAPRWCIRSRARNEHTSCGPGVPPIHFGFSDAESASPSRWCPRAAAARTTRG